MALSDLAVFTEYVYDTMTEIVAQQIELFNDASRGAINLESSSHQGDFSDRAFYAKISGLVRRRNAYGSGAVNEKNLAHLVDTMVKVAAGTPPIRMDPAWWNWIQRDPAEAGAVLGKQLAPDMMADMLNTGVAAAVAALSGQSAIQYDGTGDTPATLTLAGQNKAASKFGDMSQNIVCWIIHSTPMHDFWGASIAGTNGNEFLFRFENLNIVADAWGRVFVVSDIPALVTAGTPNVYNTLGLQVGAIDVDQNADFTDNISTLNGNENISRTYQAEWSYNIGLLGYTWDKSNGGHSPTDAALVTSSNWDKIATSVKNTAGVLLLTH